MRITQSILQNKVNYLNSIYNRTENTKGGFTLDYGCNGVRLCMQTNEQGGLADITERVSNGEMARIIDGIVNVYHRTK